MRSRNPTTRVWNGSPPGPRSPQELERPWGSWRRVEDYHHSVGQCQRCSEVVEPLISLQWFLNVGQHTDPDSIAGRAHAAVANGDIEIVPERFTRVYLNWLENIRDWCISRQLWWGHRIPVWYCADCGDICRPHRTTQRPARSLRQCANLEQESDVLDTWFSSGLWPHSTLGWPEQDCRRPEGVSTPTPSWRPATTSCSSG